MVIGQVNVKRVPIPPDKADPVPGVDTDAVLSLPVTCEFFQPVPGRDLQVVQAFSRVQEEKFPVGSPLKFPGKPFNENAIEHVPCDFVQKALDHATTITRRVINVKRYVLRPLVG